MRRYRKGQIFRPPTTAEHGAMVDSIESFRRRPARPQDHSPAEESILVKTPEDGIPARDDTTIYFALCKRCIQVYSGTEREIVETDELLQVFNFKDEDIAGDIYVPTAVTECQTRYVVFAQTTIPLLIRGTATAAITGSTGYLDNVVVLQPAGLAAADCPNWDAGNSRLPVNKLVAGDIDEDAVCYAMLNQSDPEDLSWELQGGSANPENDTTQITAVSAAQYDTETHKFQIKTRTIKGYSPGSESDWTDVFTATAKSPLTSFQVDTSTLKLQDKTTQIYVLEADEEGSWVDIHTGTDECP